MQSNTQTKFLNLIGIDPQTVAAGIGDVIVNGGFDTDSDWDKLSGATISDGAAHLLATADSAVAQYPTVDVGDTYRLRFTASAAVRVYIVGNSPIYDQELGAGTHDVFILIPEHATFTVDFIGTVAGVCAIDDVSMKKALVPARLRIEITNGAEIGLPQLVLGGDSLPTGAVICVSTVDVPGDLQGLILESAGAPVQMSAGYNESVFFQKSSAGWLPVIGKQQVLGGEP